MLGFEDDGVHGHALHFHDAVVVKAGGLREEVPFAEEGGVVASGLEELGEGGLGTVEELVEAGDAVFVGVFSGEDGGAGGGAEGVGGEGVLEAHPFFGEAVKGGGLDVFVPVATEGLAGVVVGENEDDVGLWLRHRRVNRRLCRGVR